MSNNLLFITMVAMTLFNVSAYVFVMVRFTEIQNHIKNLADNQFDAEQVMNLYAMKYAPKPKIITEQKNVMDLVAELDLPIREAENTSDMLIKEQLLKDIAEEIEPYVEFISDTDLHRLEIIYRARLQVINK